MTSKNIFITTDSNTVYKDIKDILCNYIKEYTVTNTDDVKEAEALIYPNIFIRDRKSDKKLKRFILSDYKSIRIIQINVDYDNCKADDSNKKLCKDRNLQIFKQNLSKVIVFTNIEENNNEGIEHIRYLCYLNKIPVDVYYDNILYTKEWDITVEPLNGESIEKNIYKDKNSKEYKDKLNKSMRMIRRMYYDGLKTVGSDGKLDNKELLCVTPPTSPTNKKKVRRSSSDLSSLNNTVVLNESEMVSLDEDSYE